MKTLLILLLAIATSGCASIRHRHELGVQVHSFSIGGRDFVHCSIIADRGKPQQAHDSLEVCREEIQSAVVIPEPGKAK